MSSILTGSIHLYICPRGPTDKASDYESGDCGFESHQGCFLLILSYIVISSFVFLEKQIPYGKSSEEYKKVPAPGFEPGSHG